MEGVNVIFSPVNSSEGHTAGGTTDAKGKFKLTTGGLQAGRGAVPGKYNVLFEKSTNEGFGLSPEEYNKRFSVTAPRTTYLLPRKYSAQSTSGIEPVSVEGSGKNDFAFALSAEGLEQDNAHLQEEAKPRRQSREK
jgi:hypothetical protein